MSEANKVQVGGEHYKKHTIQPWDAIQDWGLGFLDGNVVKYIARWRNKDGIKDLEKAKHYLEKLIEQERTKPATHDELVRVLMENRLRNSPLP